MPGRLALSQVAEQVQGGLAAIHHRAPPHESLCQAACAPGGAGSLHMLMSSLASCVQRPVAVPDALICRRSPRSPELRVKPLLAGGSDQRRRLPATCSSSPAQAYPQAPLLPRPP